MGNYNGTVDYATQAVYANDSWNVSMMSYLPVNINPYFNAYNPNAAAAGLSYCWLSTPAAADYVALSDIYRAQGYSTNNALTGDTTYGVNTTITAAVSDIWSLFSTYAGSTGYTLIDAGGIDTLDVSNFNQNQKIDLRVATLASTSATLCNIGGLTGNVTISPGTVIENASGGGGNDIFYGNETQNRFKGNAGNDQFYDSLESDTYFGGTGDDSIYFTDSINLYGLTYSATTSFLSVARNFTTDVDLIFNDIETLYFNNIAYSFNALVDTVAPILTSSTPGNGDSSVNIGSNITLVFNENVIAGSGFITISGGSAVRTVNIIDTSQVTFANNTVIINPSTDLVDGTSYSLTLGNGAVKDLSSNNYAGISDGAPLLFSTATALPSLAITATDANKLEGNSGSTAHTFTVTRSGDLSISSTVNWSGAGVAPNSADAADFVMGVFPSGILSFLQGETTKTVTIEVAGDSTLEFDESFSITLANPSNAKITTATAYGLIISDDVYPQLAIAADNLSVTEGQSGSTSYTFTVTRRGDLSVTSSAAWTVNGSGSTPADAADFLGGIFPFGIVSFAVDQSSQQITVPIAGDSHVERDEGFSVSLANAVNATITTATAFGIITNDDTAAPVITGITTSSIDQNLAIGETASFYVAFSDLVFVTGSSFLNLANSGIANYSGGSGSNVISFLYTVAGSNANSSDLSTASANAISLIGATIKNVLGTDADLNAANGVNPTGTLAVDTVVPLITSMVVDGNNVILTFSEPVKNFSSIAADFSRQIGTATAVKASSMSLDALTNKLTLIFTGTLPTSTSSVKLSYTPTVGSNGATAWSDQAGNPLSSFSSRVVDTYQSSATVSTLGDGTIASYANLTLTGTTAINGSGNPLTNTIVGNSNINILDGKAGVDSIDGKDGADIYLVAASSEHTAAEFNDSGSIGIDEVRFTSTTTAQTLTLFAGDVGLESCVIGTGTAVQAVTSGTAAVNIDASAVLNPLSFTGNAGNNTIRATNYNDTINGNAGNDGLNGLAGQDIITGAAGLDTLTGGADADRFVYTTLTDGVVGGTTTARTFELITDFEVGLDSIDAPGTAVRTIKLIGAVSALTNTAITNLLGASSAGSANFAANGASIFTSGTGATLRTFLAINDGTAGYSAAADAIIEITGNTFAPGFNSLTSLYVA